MYVGEGRVRDEPAPLMPVWKVASLSLVFGIVVCAHTYTVCMYCTINYMLLVVFLHPTCVCDEHERCTVI